MMKQTKLQARETEKLRQNIIYWINDTDTEKQQDRRTNGWQFRRTEEHITS
jgi:hypothetical protein